MNIQTELEEFSVYLENVKRASQNTIVSYRRDLRQMQEYLEKEGIFDLRKVTKTSLNSYILYLEQQGKETATISRMQASIKAFFHYEFSNRKISQEPAECVKAPKIEKKPPVVLSVEEITRFLSQPDGSTPKTIRDRAMLELLYATGIRVSELIGLCMKDVNMQVGFIVCRAGARERIVPFGRKASQALRAYLEPAREKLLDGKSSEYFFVNCSGGQMSRQGFWKIVKGYGEQAGIEADITPHTLRHSFAVHLLSSGANVQVVQTMLGHADLTTTLAYQKIGLSKV